MICEKGKCTGCYGCFNICPKNAIEMIEDEYGNIYPNINKSECINCGLCQKVCPAINEIELKEPKISFAMYNKDDNIRKQSTSGGAATTFYMQILNENGVIYGASNIFYKDSFDFIRIDNINDLYMVKGSKYVHCYIKNSFRGVKEDLNNKRKVLFIGTPCQVAGLKNFLNKDYENLITIDIICHGVPSQKLLFDDLRKNGYILSNSIYSISFRDKNNEDDNIFENLTIYTSQFEKKKIKNDYYYHNFLEGNIYRENCYNCRYATNKRVSDITIGDFWGLDKESKIYDNEKNGISVIIPVTDKGMNLVNSIIEKVKIEERTLEEAINGNEQLRHPSIGDIKKRKKYLKYYPKYGYEKTMKKIESFRQKLKKFKIIRLVYNFIKCL